MSLHVHFVTFGLDLVEYIVYYYVHERCIKDQEGAKSVKQRYIILLFIYTSDCKAVLTGGLAHATGVHG